MKEMFISKTCYKCGMETSPSSFFVFKESSLKMNLKNFT